MKAIKSKDWETIKRIVSNFKFLESPRDLNLRMQYETERLFNLYCVNEFIINDFVEDHIYRIIYRDEDSINDYQIKVSKITKDYIYGIGGLIKYKRIRIVGVII